MGTIAQVINAWESGKDLSYHAKVNMTRDIERVLLTSGAPVPQTLEEAEACLDGIVSPMIAMGAHDVFGCAATAEGIFVSCWREGAGFCTTSPLFTGAARFVAPDYDCDIWRYANSNWRTA